MTKISTKKVATIALLTALAYITVALIRLPISSLPFLKFEPKDVIIVIAGFIYGPIASVAISVVVSFIEMITISDTGIIGMIMNVLSSLAFTLPAAVFYSRRRTLSSAVAGLICGGLLMTATMLLWNWLITPLYMPNTTRDAIVPMLLPVFLPFNAIKASLNAAITLIIYKPLTVTLRRAHLLPAQTEKGKAISIPLVVTSVGVMAVCVLLIFILK